MYKIIHDFQYDENASAEEKRAKIDERFDVILKSGYDGIVTNVPFKDYLCDEEGWKILDYVMDKAEEKGLKIWFYDEKGWPSGSAGGLTLKNHSEYETKAVVISVERVKAGESVKIPFPHNHLKTVYAAAYQGTDLDNFDIDTAENLTQSVDENGDVQYANASDNDKIVCAFYLRRFYEGSAQSCGLFAARRSIDVSDERAVKEFIKNTYEQYVSRYGGRFDAFFTDEPGYPGFYYLTDRGDKQKIDDMPDWNTPLLPPINWGNDFEVKFKKIKGYDIIPYLPYLFGNASEKAKRVRFDFYEVLSELYEKAYFKQLGDYCEENGCRFSGHIQSEDNMKQHALYEGDLFRLLRNMRVPGIDMLTSTPETILNAPDEHFPPLGGADEIINWATGPKTVSSISRLNGRKGVMCEVSANLEGGVVSNEKRIGALLLQYALGVTVFTAYYKDFVEELNETNRVLKNLYANVSDMRASMQVGLYYPIQQMWAYLIPAGTESYVPCKTDADNVLDVVQYSFSKLNRELLINQADPEIIGYDFLAAAEIKDGKYYCGGGEYETLVIPACVVDENLKGQILRFARGGIKTVIVTHPRLNQDLSFCADMENVIVLKNEADLAAEIRKTLALPYVTTLCGGKNFVCQVKGSVNDDAREYVLVNFTDESYASTVELSGVSKEGFSVYEPITDIRNSGEITETERGVKVKLAFKPYSAFIIKAKVKR